MLKYVKVHPLWYELCTTATEKEYEEIREWIKRIFPENERRFDYKVNKHWMVRSTPTNRGILESDEWMFKSATAEDDAEGAADIIYPYTPVPLPAIDATKLPKGIRTYQTIGARMLLSRNGNMILADDMGLGKSLQTLTFLLYSKKYPTLVICPAIAKNVWEDEISKWLHVPFYTCEGRKPKHIPRSVSIIIINYDILTSWETVLVEFGIKHIVADECHRLKSEDTKWVQSFIRMATEIKSFTPISGTPILSFPAEFWVILHQIAPEAFPDKRHFLQRYCNPHYNQYGEMIYDGCTHAAELYSKVRPYMIRRRKADVAKDLPAKNHIKLVVNLDNYDRYLAEERTILEDSNTLTIKQRLLALNRTAYYGKRDYIITWLTDWLEENPGEKIVVLTYHQAVLDDLVDAFPDIAVTLDGRTSKKARRAHQDQFRNDAAIRIFFGEIIACNVAVTLTAASTMAIVEFVGVPGVMSQAEDRIHRLTQTKTCNIYLFLGKGTIEERTFTSLNRRAKYTSAVLDGKEVKYIDDTDIEQELFMDIKERAEAHNR